MKTHLIQPNPNVAEVKLIYKSKVPASERAKIKCSSDAFNILFNQWDKDTIEHIEEFKVLLLNRSNKVLGILTVSKGGISGTIVDTKVIFQAAIKSNATSLILAHNHPSGNREPSEADLRITEKVWQGGKILDISVLDHLILTPEETYYSLSDSGQMGT